MLGLCLHCAVRVVYIYIYICICAFCPAWLMAVAGSIIPKLFLIFYRLLWSNFVYFTESYEYILLIQYYYGDVGCDCIGLVSLCNNSGLHWWLECGCGRVGLWVDSLSFKTWKAKCNNIPWKLHRLCRCHCRRRVNAILASYERYKHICNTYTTYAMQTHKHTKFCSRLSMFQKKKRNQREYCLNGRLAFLPDMRIVFFLWISSSYNAAAASDMQLYIANKQFISNNIVMNTWVVVNCTSVISSISIRSQPPSNCVLVGPPPTIWCCVEPSQRTANSIASQDCVCVCVCVYTAGAFFA